MEKSSKTLSPKLHNRGIESMLEGELDVHLVYDKHGKLNKLWFLCWKLRPDSL